MGILFSRPDIVFFPAGAYAAGEASSVNASTIHPYLGVNTGLYRDIPIKELPPIPFEWIVSPSDIDKTCPSGSNILTAFAITETVITLLTPLVAYRPVVHFLSRGTLGRRIKGSVALTWTVVFVCQLLANAVIAGMVGNTPGYGGLNMLHLFTVYMARPRFHFAVLGLLRSLVGVKRNRDMDKTRIVDKKRDGRVEFPYTDAYITTAVSEMLLLIISAVFTGVTWHRLPSDSKAREYTSDIVSFVYSTPAVMLLCVGACVPLNRRYGDAFPIQGRRYETGRHWGASVAADGTATIRVKEGPARNIKVKRIASAVVSAVLMGFVSLVQWSYWSKFLEMPGVLFCPPKLIQSGAIWVIFTIVGTLAGAAS
ncbi:hypothetical protein B0J13DRAFT_58290 [Dactylonectria estremocensis]|uniref:Uncharacterized protein n=1 Tax=Dactylonectria estremocensis TaxID=1079267 RepID=A0A9P9EPU6_9HYPO|nr:hypothetical protein B0J13DRAFT_58290 [Dactylonectria estremocensis]